MSTLTIYGASDDLIEVDGDIREEFDSCEEDKAVLAFSDGTVLSVHYDGQWTFKRVVKGSATFTKDEATSDEGKRPDGKPAYSDVVTLEGEIRWVVYGRSMAMRR